MLPTLVSAPAPRATGLRARRPDLGLLQLAGHLYHHADAIWPTLRAGQRLRLKREPWNRHDPCAVALYAGPDKLGYIPRHESAAVARLDPADGPRVWVRLGVG